MAEKRVTVWVQRFKDRTNLVLQWIDPVTGRRKSESAGTSDPDKAERARADKEYELNHGLHQDVSRMSWARFRELFEEEYLPNVREKTGENYQNTMNLFEELAHPTSLRSITARTVSTFATRLRTTPVRGGRAGMQASTVSVRLQFLHAVLNWAVDQGMLPKCPPFPEVKVPKKKPKPVPAESFERLAAKAPDAQTAAFLLCGWLAGLRLAEAIHLEWEETDEAPWVDLGRDRIWLPAELVKADEDQWVPLDPALRKALEALPRQGRRVFRFVATDGHTLSNNGVAARVSRLAKKAGVKLTMRVLRRGFGCRYAARVPAQVLQRLMRHSNIAITMDYYANVDEAVEEAVLGPKRNTSRNSTPEIRTRGVSNEATTEAHPVGQDDPAVGTAEEEYGRRPAQEP
jgi:integrase